MRVVTETTRREVIPLADEDGKLIVTGVTGNGGGGVVRASLTNRSGSTSGTANAWTQVSAANATRNGFFLQNISDTTIEVGVGAASSEFTIASVAAGSSFSFGSVVSIDRVVVRCPTAGSKAFYATEA